MTQHRQSPVRTGATAKMTYSIFNTIIVCPRNAIKGRSYRATFFQIFLFFFQDKQEEQEKHETFQSLEIYNRGQNIWKASHSNIWKKNGNMEKQKIARKKYLQIEASPSIRTALIMRDNSNLRIIVCKANSYAVGFAVRWKSTFQHVCMSFCPENVTNWSSSPQNESELSPTSRSRTLSLFSQGPSCRKSPSALFRSNWVKYNLRSDRKNVFFNAMDN